MNDKTFSNSSRLIAISWKHISNILKRSTCSVTILSYLTIRKRHTHTTRFGGFLTVLLTILSNFAVYCFGREIFDRRKPNVSSAKTHSIISILLPIYLEGSFEEIMLSIYVYDSLKEKLLE